MLEEMKPDAAVRLANIRGGIIGLLGTLASKKINPAIPVAPKTMGTKTSADFHGCICPPVVIPYNSETIDPVKMAIPIQSKFFMALVKDASGGSSLRNARIPMAVRTQIGIVIRNTLYGFC